MAHTLNWVWQGASGKGYLFKVFESPVDWSDIDQGGIYVFAKVRFGIAIPLYVGQADSLYLVASDKDWVRAQIHGAHQAHALVENAPEFRLVTVHDLIQALQLKCNIQAGEMTVYNRWRYEGAGKVSINA